MLDIERTWGKWPGWFATLHVEDQALLLADRKIEVKQIQEARRKAKASQRTIVITERLVSTEEIRREPDRTVIPGFRVSHVVELPFSAHPSSVYNVYDFDREHIELYAKASKTKEGFLSYLDEYVHNVKDHSEYLKKVGGKKRLKELIADPELGY